MTEGTALIPLVVSGHARAIKERVATEGGDEWTFPLHVTRPLYCDT
jgi:hypothetical protein